MGIASDDFPDAVGPDRNQQSSPSGRAGWPDTSGDRARFEGPAAGGSDAPGGLAAGEFGAVVDRVRSVSIVSPLR